MEANITELGRIQLPEHWRVGATDSTLGYQKCPRGHIVIRQTQRKTHGLLEWQARHVLSHTHPECGSDQEPVILLSHPVPQISSASSGSYTPCGCPKLPLINGSWTQNVSRDRKVNSPELSQVKVVTERNLAASTAGTLCQVAHPEDPRSTQSLDACWGRRSAQNVQQGNCNTRGVTVKLFLGCVVYKKPHTGSEGWQGARLPVVSESQQRLRLQRCW